jgi:cobyrinic acid a,c-diamide synthase
MGYDSSIPLVFRLTKGYGVTGNRDGLLYRNTLACYSHIHAVGNKDWAKAMVRSAQCFGKRGLGGVFDPKSDLKQNGLSEVHRYVNLF